MLKKFIKSLIREELSVPDQSGKLAELEKENAALKAKLESSGPSQRLAKLKTMAAQIPDSAQGMGMIMVIENGSPTTIKLSLRLKPTSSL